MCVSVHSKELKDFVFLFFVCTQRLLFVLSSKVTYTKDPLLLRTAEARFVCKMYMY